MGLKDFQKAEAEGRRELVHQQMRMRFIGKEERAARCDAAAQSMGYKSIYTLGIENGISHQSMKSSLNSTRMSLTRMEELCTILKCSVSYLTERKIDGLK